MKLPRFTKILIAVALLLIVFVCLAPSREALSSTAGLWGSRILLNRIRDFAAIPISCGIWLVILGSAYLSCGRKQAMNRSAKRPLLIGFGVMALIGIYWTAAIVCMGKLPLMPTRLWLALMTRSGWFCLWWAIAGALLLCAMYPGGSKQAPVENE